MYNIAITGHRPHAYKFASKLPETNFENAFTSKWAVSFMDKMTELIIAKVKQYGKVPCITGMALGVDQLFAMAAIRAKVETGNVIVHAAVPCINHSSKWPYKTRKVYDDILKNCDEIHIVHNGPYTKSCLQERNEYMVDMCNELIAIWNGTSGGTANCIRYAQETHCKINIMTPISFIDSPAEYKAS